MSPLPRAIGIVCLVVGAVWLLQGIGVAQGSVMTGSTLWAILGAATLVVGGLVLRRVAERGQGRDRRRGRAGRLRRPTRPTI